MCNDGVALEAGGNGYKGSVNGNEYEENEGVMKIAAVLALAVITTAVYHRF